MLWTQVELSIGIVVACLPTLQPLLGSCGLGRAFATFRSSTKASSGASNSGSAAKGGGGRGDKTAVAGGGDRNGDRNGDWSRLVDGTAGLAPAGQTVTWTVEDGDGESDDGIPLKGIRVQRDLEQNMQRGLRLGRDG